MGIDGTTLGRDSGNSQGSRKKAGACETTSKKMPLFLGLSNLLPEMRRLGKSWFREESKMLLRSSRCMLDVHTDMTGGQLEREIWTSRER